MHAKTYGSDHSEICDILSHPKEAEHLENRDEHLANEFELLTNRAKNLANRTEHLENKALHAKMSRWDVKDFNVLISLPQKTSNEYVDRVK